VLAGVAIVAGVVATFMSFGAATPLLGLGCVLAGAAISSYGYTKTLDSDRAAGRERSWAQFYLERTAGEFKGAAAGAVVFAGLLSGYELIGMAGGISSSIPSIVTAGTSGGTMAGAVEAAGLGEAVLGIGSMAALLAAAMKSGEGGESKEGVGIEKKDSNADISDASKDIWSKGTFDSIEDSLKYHFNKHGQEVGAKDINQYVRKAKEFSKNLKRARVSYPKEGTPGAKTYTKNGKYITIDSDGKILTFGLER
ncbi:MAG: hypothetical protein K2P60_10550, partial [Lachnospiraceae bacterium]|nr:hypothetical protein [Lachnospiraceae bacterium]